MVRKAGIAEHHLTFKGKAVAQRKALEWANLNDHDGEIALGVPYLSSHWNGQRSAPIWLAYDVVATEGGWTIVSYRWKEDPTT